MPDAPVPKETGKTRRRMPSDQRRQEFIDKSIKLFAEEGFESSTRELARRLGVTQPLLYRYFPSKQDLIAEVYDQVYLRRWQPEWEALIADRSQPLHDRLVEFYSKYTDAIFHPDWIRIYLYSGLKGVEINSRYMELVHSHPATHHRRGPPPCGLTVTTGHASRNRRRLDDPWRHLLFRRGQAGL